jgi:D-alanine-D-alanine ligase
MDKETAKILCSQRGIPVTPWVTTTRAQYRSSPSAARTAITDTLRFPLFVKPANGGSSVGVTKVKSPDQLGAALDAAFECDSKAIVETGIDAREIECAVLGNDAPEASVLGEIVPSSEFYDYAAKYLDGASELKIPAPIPEAKAAEIRNHAVAAFLALGLAGLARIDFFLDRGDGRVFVNEANTLPGFTPISMYPKLWEASGLPYTDLLSKLLDLAVARGTAERARATRYTG